MISQTLRACCSKCARGALLISSATQTTSGDPASSSGCDLRILVVTLGVWQTIFMACLPSIWPFVDAHAIVLTTVHRRSTNQTRLPIHHLRDLRSTRLPSLIGGLLIPHPLILFPPCRRSLALPTRANESAHRSRQLFLTLPLKILMASSPLYTHLRPHHPPLQQVPYP